MDNIYDTLAKLNKVANRPEAKKVVKEDSNGMMRKGLKNLINKSSKMNKQSNYTPFSDKQSPDGLPEKKKDTKMFEKESDVERDDRAEKAGREVKRDAKYDDRRHAGKDGKSVTKDIEYDEKHDKDGMHEAQGYDDKEDESLGMRTGKESSKKQSMKDRRDDSYGKFGKRDKEHEDGKMHMGENSGTLKDAARQGVLARLAELAGIPAQEIDEALGTPQDIAAKIMSENPIEEDSEEITNTGREEELSNVDRDSITIDMVKPAIEKMLASYEADANEWNNTYTELEKEVRAKGVTDPKQIQTDVFNMDDDIVSYTNIDDLEDKIDAIKRLMKQGDADGNDIVDLASSGPSDTIAREEFMQELKTAIKQDHPEVYSKLFMYGIGESMDEGNEFSGERDKAIKAGKNDFTVDGKTYPVKGDKNESLEEADDDSDMPSKAHIEKMCKDGKTKKEICDMHPNCDQGELKKMIDDCGELNEGGGRDMDCATCDGTGKDDDKECKSCEGSGEAQDDDDPMNNESKVEETTSAGSVADGAGSGSSPYKNASVYESNEIVKRARQLNEDMSFTVSGGPEQEPTLNINASGEEAMQLAQLLKLSGMGMTPAAPQYGEVEIQVAEDQEFANSNQNEETADTNTLVNTISGGLNGQKKMAYPRASQGDNAMATLGESELVATSANQLMKQYEAFKTK